MADAEHDRSALAEELQKSLNKSTQIGDPWYLVHQSWLGKCKRYIGLDEINQPIAPKDEHPGQIDNSALMCPNDSSQLQENLLENVDYNLVPDEAWQKLVEVFGLVEGQEPICRYVRNYGMFNKTTRVEVYLLSVSLAKMSEPTETVKRHFSRATLMSEVKEEMHSALNIPKEKETRLWTRFNTATCNHLDNMDQSIVEAGLYKDSLLLIEEKNEDGTWPNGNEGHASKLRTKNSTENGETSAPDVSSSKDSSSTAKSIPLEVGKEGASSSKLGTYPITVSSRFSNYGASGSSESSQPGVCGLTNLGNTCFMNSIIQGLSNTPQIVEYFENDNFEEDINVDNPLGMKGEIAKAFGQLIQDMWSGRYKYIDPRNFKMVVGKFAPGFSGYQQHDSQELLTFLLDGLHEDLNRIKKKPYIEMSDSDGKPDVEVAREAWGHYKKRNDSVILDIFHCLLKSTLVCPVCSKVSVKFDPMCYLSLPLPVKKERQIEVVFVPMSSNMTPIKYKVTCPKVGTISDLTSAASSLMKVPADNLMVTDVYNHRFHKVYKNDDDLSQIMDQDEVYIYQVPEDKDQVIMTVYMRKRKSGSCHSPSTLFGRPLLVGVPRRIKYGDLCSYLLDRMSRYVSRPADGEEWWRVQAATQETVPPPPPPPPNNNRNNQFMGGNFNERLQDIGVEKMEVNGDSEGCSNSVSCSSSTNSSSSNSVNNVEVEGVNSNQEAEMPPINNMPILVDGTQQNETSPPDEEKTTNGLTNGLTSQKTDWDLDMSDDELSNNNPPRLFDLTYVNSYGNNYVDSLSDHEDSSELELSEKSCLALDWHPRAIELFFKEKEAGDFEEDSSLSAPITQKKQVIQLNECLKLFTTQEKLKSDNSWYCPKCKEMQEATKKMDLWMLPEVLVIHLKRFFYNRYIREKIDALVQFPVEGLDMTPYVIQPGHGEAVYDLIAVSNHYGGMGGGHYTAYGKNKDDGKWYYFDDSNVTVAQGDIVTKAAYVLFYKRRTPSRASATVTSGMLNGHHEPDTPMDTDS